MFLELGVEHLAGQRDAGIDLPLHRARQPEPIALHLAMESVVAVWRNPVVAAAAPVVVAERPARNAGVIVAPIGLAVRTRRGDGEIALAPACHPAEQIILILGVAPARIFAGRSEEHPSELQSLMRISSAVFFLQQKTTPP